jgi:hypothetical protein
MQLRNTPILAAHPTLIILAKQNQLICLPGIPLLNCIATPIYKRRNPQATVLYQVVQNNFLEWSGNYSLRHDEVLPGYVEKEFKDYFKCGILAHGFARAYCASCGNDYLVGFSCKRRGVCPSCNTKHMISITTHLLEKVLPKLPLRQWVLSVPKWLRYYLVKEAALASQVLRMFMSEIEKQLIKSCDGITDDAKLGAVSFIQRFGSRLNLHIHFHCVVFDGVFYTDQKGTLQFADVYNFGKEDTDHVEARVRQRVLSLFKRRGLLSEDEVENIKGWKGSGGFSVNADVHIEDDDRRGAERLIRYCARPAFSGEKLKLLSEKAETADSTRLQYDVNKGSQNDEPPMILSATELFDNLAKLIPPPHRHRHHYHGVLAPNSKYRANVTQFANEYYRPDTAESLRIQTALEIEAAASKLILKSQPKAGAKNWARLIAKVYEVDPLKCESCGGEMKLIAFIRDSISITQILTHLGEEVEVPKMQCARAPPDDYQIEQEFVFDPEPDYPIDQTVAW